MSSIYDALRRPLVTEKTNYLVNKLHQYVFEVAADGSYAEPVDVSGLATEYTLSLDGSRLVYTGGDVDEASYQTRQQVYARELASCAEWQLSPAELADYTCSNLSVSNQDRYIAFDAALVPAGGTLAEATSREVWVAALDGSHAWRCRAPRSSHCSPSPVWRMQSPQASMTHSDEQP